MWHLKEHEGKDANIRMAAPGFILLASELNKNKKTKSVFG
jgi:hypothetical protein